jgi:SAM-dependent methyltransferase
MKRMLPRLKTLARSPERSFLSRTASRCLGWIQRRSWPKADRIAGEFYRAVTTTPDMHAYYDQADPIPDVSGGIPKTVPGTCYVCDRNVNFEVNVDLIAQSSNWRETLRCPGCELINRWRSSIHLFEELIRPKPDDRIYLTEAITPLFRAVAARYAHCVGSEYAADTPLGTEIDLPAGPTRIEDVTRLTFPDASFEAVLSFDVLEHVPDYKSALREFCRVLSPGGQVMISVPSTFADHTLVRAEMGADGQVRHLMEPAYHGDPLSDEGVLCYYDFGLDLLNEMKLAGFRDAFLVCYTSRPWGYYGAHLMFVGRKG